jgi:hypothetical protein
MFANAQSLDETAEISRVVGNVGTYLAVIDLAKSKSISPRFCDLIGGYYIWLIRAQKSVNKRFEQFTCCLPTAEAADFG